MSALDIAAARAEVARVLGGTQIRAGVYGGSGAVAAGGRSIKIAWANIAEAGSLNNDGVCAVVFYGGTEISGGGSDLVAYTHRLRIHLVLSVMRSMLHEAEAILLPFIPAIRTAFTHVKLGGTADNCELEAISDLGDSPYYPDRIAIDFTLRVTQKEAVAFAA